jgi:hypothetical protein
MKKTRCTDVVSCPECEADLDVTYYPGSPGQTYGPPEQCSPPEGDDIDCPEECPECGRKFTERDLDRFCEELGEEYRDRREDRY